MEREGRGSHAEEHGSTKHCFSHHEAFSYLISSSCGGQVRQTAAGHRPKPLPASPPLLLLLPPSLTKPGKGQAGGHGGEWTWRRHLRGLIHQVTTWPPARRQWLRLNFTHFKPILKILGTFLVWVEGCKTGQGYRRNFNSFNKAPQLFMRGVCGLIKMGCKSSGELK